MPQGYAVIVGLTRVDPLAYGGRSMTSGCWGAEEDVDRIVRLVTPLGFVPTTLKTSRATAGAVLDHLRWAARTTRSGDLFLFYFAGHGQQRIDESGDESDGFDELVLTFDRPIDDDELDEAWREFAEGVRIVVLSDACHSGTNFKFPGGWKRAPVRPRSAPRPFLKPMKAALVHIGASRDEELAAADRGGGAFTLALCSAFHPDFDGDHWRLVERISADLSLQHPRIELYGPRAAELAGQRPFAVSAGFERRGERRK
jgi:hypothetical protein